MKHRFTQKNRWGKRQRQEVGSPTKTHEDITKKQDVTLKMYGWGITFGLMTNQRLCYDRQHTMSPTGLCITVLKPQVWQYVCCHLVFLHTWTPCSIEEDLKLKFETINSLENWGNKSKEKWGHFLISLHSIAFLFETSGDSPCLWDYLNPVVSFLTNHYLQHDCKQHPSHSDIDVWKTCEYGMESLLLLCYVLNIKNISTEILTLTLDSFYFIRKRVCVKRVLFKSLREGVEL